LNFTKAFNTKTILLALLRYVSLMRRDKHLLSWLSFGVFLIVVGAIFLATQNLTNQIEAFFEDFELEQVSGEFYFPAPQNPHPTLYGAVALFCLAFGVYQILLLFLKFALGATLVQRAETFTSIIFWLTASFAVTLLKNQAIEWFLFIAVLIVLVAVGIVIRSLASMIAPEHHKPYPKKTPVI
jgi:hypothetical protein